MSKCMLIPSVNDSFHLEYILVPCHFAASAEVEINETVNTSVGEGETSFIEIPYDSDEGVTIKVNVTNGTITVYASDQTTTPNEAFYDWMIETGGYSDVYLDPTDVNRTIGDTVYVAIEGEDTDNDFTFVSEEGDTTGRVFVYVCLHNIMIPS